MEEERRVVLKSILTNGASERLANIALVKPEKARQIENYLLQLAQSGRLGNGAKVSEDEVKELLKKFAEQTQKSSKITIQRRKNMFDDDDDDDADDDW